MIVSGRLQALLADDERAVDVLHRYFRPRPPGAFTGSWFERLAGGGDRPPVADYFTSDDLLAVSMLSVPVVGDSALEILHIRRDQLRSLLRQIPTDVALADLTSADLGDDWPVRAAYRELLRVPNVGVTTATKLLARKRPHLVPIWDQVVDAELSLTQQQLWTPLHGWLTDGEKSNHLRLLELRDLAGLESTISALRVFDVLTWMIGSGRVDGIPAPGIRHG